MPDWSGEIRRRLSAVRLPPEREAAIGDELAQHLEDRYQTLLASGQPAAEAERRAWRELEGDDVPEADHNRAFRANSSQLARSGKWKDVKDLRGRWIVNERRISA